MFDLSHLPGFKPLKDEAYESYLARVSTAVAMESIEFTQAIMAIAEFQGFEFQRTDLLKNTEPQARFIASFFNLRLEIAKRLFLPSQYSNCVSSKILSHKGRPRSFYAHSMWVLPRGSFCYCPKCLSEDPEPYFRKSWRLSITTACPIHNTPMLSACLNCSKAIALSNAMGSLRYCQTCGSDLCAVRIGKTEEYIKFMKLLIKAVFLEHITTSGMNYIDHRPIDNWSVAGTFIDFVTLGNIDIVNTFATSRKKLPYGISWQTADLGQRSIFISSFYNFSGQSYNERRATYRAWPLSCQIDYEKLMKIQDSIPIPIYLNIPQWIEQPRFNPPDRSKAFNSINISLKGFTEFKSSIYGMWLYRIKERQTLFLFANTNFDIVMNEMYKSHAIKCDNEPREQFISSDEIENRVFKCEVCNDMYIITLCNNMLSAPKIVHSP